MSKFVFAFFAVVSMVSKPARDPLEFEGPKLSFFPTKSRPSWSPTDGNCFLQLLTLKNSRIYTVIKTSPTALVTAKATYM